MKLPALTSISHGIQAVVGAVGVVVGVLGDPSVIGFLPHKIAVPVTIASGVLAALSRSPLHAPAPTDTK